ncbi:hypothetical protein ACFL6S_23930 [Candidatus Poribacteria bacterium]
MNPDDYAYIAFWKEMIRGEIYFEWTTPKPFHVILFGILYEITHSLFAVALVFAVAMSLLIYYVCKLMTRISGNPMPCLFLLLFVVVNKFFTNTVMTGGSGLFSALFIFVALNQILVKESSIRRLGNPIIIVSLSLAGLARPESWISSTLIIAYLYAAKYLRKGHEKSYRDLLLLIPMLMPLVWHLFDYVAFGDPFYSTKMTRGYAENMHNAFGSSYTFVWSRYPRMLKGYLLAVFQTPLLIVSLIGLIWMCIKKPKSLLPLMIPFLSNILFYFVIYVQQMTLVGRFFFYNYVLIVILASTAVGFAAKLTRRIRIRGLRGAVKVGIVSVAALFLIALPIKKTLFPMFPSLRRKQTVRENVKTAVNAVMADKDFRDDSFLIVSAEHEGRICVMVPSKGSRVFPIRELAALEGIPMFERDILSLMHFMAQNRARYAYNPIEKLVKLEEVPVFRKAVFFSIQVYSPRSGKVKKLFEKLKEQSESVDVLIDRGNLKVCKFRPNYVFLKRRSK